MHVEEREALEGEDVGGLRYTEWTNDSRPHFFTLFTPRRQSPSKYVMSKVLFITKKNKF
jgi:hypothetical protein